MSRVLLACINLCVSLISALLGLRLPLGWLGHNTRLDVLCSKAALKTRLGSTTVCDIPPSLTWYGLIIE